MGPVRSSEFKRVFALPRRAPDALATPDLTPLVRAPGGTWSLRPVQSWALAEAAEHQGGFFQIGVGHGKTLISLLLPGALGHAVSVLLVPPNLLAQLLYRDVPAYAAHFVLPTVIHEGITIHDGGPGAPVLHVLAYSALSSKAKTGELERIAPTLVIADEAHNLRHASAVRTRRAVRYLRTSGARFVAMSGTLTSKSLRDYAHLAELSLGAGAPMPRPTYYHDLCAWAEAIDVDGQGGAGYLRTIVAPGETVRDAYGRRLVETPGVISTGVGSCGASLVIHPQRPRPPRVVTDALTTLADTWAWDGVEYDDAKDVARLARCLSLGYFYRAVWPGGIVDHEYLAARNAYRATVRDFLRGRSRPGLDAPSLVADALDAGRLSWPTYDAWRAVCRRPPPGRQTVWLDPFVVRLADAWSKIYLGGIIWAYDPPIGEAIAKAIGVPWFGEDTDRELAAATPAKHPTIVCSARAHGTGKNLQAWCRSLVTSPSSSGAIWEQLIGRTHREGQEADQVDVYVNLHTTTLENAWAKALASASYIETTTRSPQKLLAATILP